jgi:predicted O-methyltransferase YrrM
MSNIPRPMRRLETAFTAGLAQYMGDVDPALEVVYQRLFSRDLKRVGIEDVFYPLGSSANYSLLYVILRVALDFKPRNVLDIGCGQTTLLLSSLRDRGMVGQVTTLEHDPDWASEIAPLVSHAVICKPLFAQTIAGVQTNTYDWSAVLQRGPFDFVICDGPQGDRRRSRWGVLKTVEALSRDFVLVMDDAERRGEKQTCDELQRLLVPTGAKRGRVVAAKKQCIFAGGQYARAAHF